LFFAEKCILLVAVLLLILLNYDWLNQQEHLPEFLILLFSALLGMFLMISSGNLLMFYLSLELATIPVAAMANFDLKKRTSGEAAMKMILSSAFASGILLFGISLVYGTTGNLLLMEMPGLFVLSSPLTLLAFIFVFAGFAFKLSVVPFHLWTADVYEGAPVTVSAFLSVISKGAISFVFITFLYRVFAPLAGISFQLLTLLAAITILIGNLFAIRQKNLKRFLAFSSIAQVGFILLALLNPSSFSFGAIVFFVLVYVFSNLAAFGVVSILSQQSGKEGIEDLKGLYQNNKLISWALVLSLFSLAGIPPTAGFFGKWYLILAGAKGATVVYILFIALNLVISLYYYLRIVRAVFATTEAPLEAVTYSGYSKWALIICIAGILVLGLSGGVFEHFIQLAAAANII
jgi:NADH-quinone oxidoreductase subunit N